MARARYRVLILEKDDFGGQITITNEVVNYPGASIYIELNALIYPAALLPLPLISALVIPDI